MTYLALLLDAPGREILAVDLLTLRIGTTNAPQASAPRLGLDAGPILDDSARKAYRRRISELRDDLEDAE